MQVLLDVNEATGVLGVKKSTINGQRFYKAGVMPARMYESKGWTLNNKFKLQKWEFQGVVSLDRIESEINIHEKGVYKLLQGK